MVDLETDGISPTRSRRRSRRSARSSRTSSRTSRTPPATRCPRPSARGCWSSRRSTTSRSSRTTRTSTSASRARRSTRCSRTTTAGKVVYASSFSKTVCPGIRVGYLVGPQAVIKAIQTIATNTYISPNMVAQSIVYQFASRADGRRDRDGQDRAEGAPRRGRRRAPARAARGEVRGAVRRLLHVGGAARGGRRGRAREGGCRARACCSSRAPTSSSRAARTPFAWRIPA